MLLVEIAEGTSLTIVLRYNTEKHEFPTTAVRPVKEGLLVEPITEQGKMINFVNKTNMLYQLTLVNAEDSRLYKWNKIKVKAIRDREGKSYHMLVSDLEGQVYNRRQSFRVPVLLNGIAQFGPNKKTHEVVIKNISAGGIGFDCKDDIDCIGNMLIHLSFEDSLIGASFHLHCQAVRKVTSEQTESIFYGCRFLTESPAINNYIQKRQQRLLVKNELPQKIKKK